MASNELNQLVQAQMRYQDTLLNKANVVGVAVGYKNRQGASTGDLSVVALVQEKVPLAALSADDMIPEELEGAKTDVYEVGVLRAHEASPKGRFRPAPGGVSIAHPKVGAGTLGVLVKDRTTGEPLILSNNHVLAASNDALVGDPILQPGPLDGGQNPGDVVAKLERFVKLYYEGDDQPEPDPGGGDSGCDIVDLIVDFANLLARLNGSEKRVEAKSAPSAVVAAQSIANKVDAAVAKPVDNSLFTTEVRHIGQITGTRPVTLGMQVRKAGRTTDYTEGTVTLMNATVNVGYRTNAGNRTARFTGQIITTAMSQPGDSGSLVVAQDSNEAVGLLYAGSNISTIFTPIDVVLDELNLTF